MKKIKLLSSKVVLMGLLAGCFMVLAGCSKEAVKDNSVGNVKEEAATKSNGPAQLVISRWAGPHADDQKEVLQMYKDADVKMDDIDYGNLKEKQIQSLSTSGDYDLVWFQEIWLNDYVEKGFLLPLNDYVKEKGVDLGTYAPSMIEQNTIDGNLYGFPTYAQTYILTYNKEWFEKEGQKVPATPEELVAAAKYFKEKGTGIAIPALQGMAAADVYATFLYSYGGDYFNADGKVDFNTDAARKAFKLWSDLCQNSITGSATMHNDQVSQAIREEKAPFGITITGLASMDSDEEVSLIKDKVGYAPIPGENGTTGVVSFWSWGIAKNSKNPEAAFDLATWLTSPAIEKKQSLMNGQIAAVTSLGDDNEVVTSMPFLPATNAMLAKAKTQPSTGTSSEIFEPLCAELSAIAAEGKDIDAVVTDLNNALKDVTK